MALLRSGESAPDQQPTGRTVERRKAQRKSIQVDVEIAHPDFSPCRGYAENVSRSGVSVILWEGAVPRQQQSVVLNFKIWTGNEILYRKLYARLVRSERGRVAFRFVGHDSLAEGFIQDLMFYQRRERRRVMRGSPSRQKRVSHPGD